MKNINDKLPLIAKSLGEERVKFSENLSYHTQTKMGGQAKIFYIATSQFELIEALNLAFELDIKFLVVGSGSKIFTNDDFEGFVIKNRTSAVKINGVKGKAGRSGIGIEEAMVEVDSGVSIGKLDEFLSGQNLRETHSKSFKYSTLGGVITLDNQIQQLIIKVKIWEKGDVYDKEIVEIKARDIILSAVLKVKANT